MPPAPHLKVLWVSHLVPYPPRAGVLLRSYNLLKQVSGHHDVHLVSFVQRSWMTTFFDSVDAGLAEAEQELGRYCRLRGWLPIPSDRSGRIGRPWLAARSLLSRNCYTVNWLHSAVMQRTLLRLKEEGGWNLVHFDTISLAPYRPIFKSVPATLGHHNVESHMLRRRATQDSNPGRRAYLNVEAQRLERYEKRVAHEFDLHITCSVLDSERLTALVPSISVVDVANGVDCEFFSRRVMTGGGAAVASAEHQHDLLFVGTMDWYPNAAAMDFFLESVWPKLLERRPDLTLGIVGSNPSARLRKTAQATRGVTVHGYVDDVRPYLAGASVYVCPIRDGGGTKLKILDALAMECCVVAHPVACEGIAVRDGETVRLATEPERFVCAILDLLDHPGQRRQMGAAGRMLVERRYSYESLGQRLAELWASVGNRQA